MWDILDSIVFGLSRESVIISFKLCVVFMLLVSTKTWRELEKELEIILS